MKDNYLRLLLGAIYPVILVSLLSTSLYAQDEAIDDPLNNPAAWKRLLDDHKNKALWEDYVGMKWDKLNDAQRKDIMKWQNYISIEIIAQREAVYDMNATEEQPQENTNVNSEDFWKASPSEEHNNEAQLVQEQREIEKTIYLTKMEEAILAEPTLLVELKSNIEANFDIIEDMFWEEYADLEIDYRFYSDVHPDEDYNKERWINDRSKELRYFKMKVVEKRKAELAASNSF